MSGSGGSGISPVGQDEVMVFGGTGDGSVVANSDNFWKKHPTIKKIKDWMDGLNEAVWEPVKNSAKLAASSVKPILAGLEPAKEIEKVAEVAGKIKTFLSVVGIAAFVTAFLTICKVPFKVIEAFEKNGIGDLEGTILAATDAIAAVPESMGDLGTGLSAASTLGAVVASPVLAFFSMIALPFAIAGLGYAVAKGTYDLVQNARVIYDLNKQMKQNPYVTKVKVLSDYIFEKLYADGSKVKFDEGKVSILTRRADKKIVDLMKSIDINKLDEAKAEAALNHMKGLMWRKIGVNSVGVLSNAGFLGLMISTIFVPVLRPFALPITAGAKVVVGFIQKGLNGALDKWNTEHTKKLLTVNS